MVLHYCIYPSKTYTCGSIVRFYISNISPLYIASIAEYVRESMDKSLGKCDLFDWEYETDSGTFRIIMNRGIDEEITMQAMNKIKDCVIKHFQF